MKKKKIAPFLNRQYKRLEQAEEKTRKGLNGLIYANSAALQDIIYKAFQSCMSGGKVDYSRLFHKLPRKEAAALQQKTAKTRRFFKKENIEGIFPFNVTNFDQLHRLDATRAEIALNQLEYAAQEKRLIEAHLGGFVSDCLIELEEYLDLYDMMDAAAIVAYVTPNRQHPIGESILRTNAHIADQITERVKASIIRNEAPDKAATSAAEYAERTDRGTSDKLLYTEGTRATVETVIEAVKPFIEAFYTVCVHDGKTCKKCAEIERVQVIDPVLVEYMSAGENAPPFHPFCRCGVEVTWIDEDIQDERVY